MTLDATSRCLLDDVDLLLLATVPTDIGTDGSIEDDNDDALFSFASTTH
jgi:hypothetical protein